jgi:long-subunit fatty acid transport protein
MRRVAIILALLLWWIPIGASAQQVEEPDVNEPTAGNFFGVGARAMGMGGASIACSMDATALVYNPAGLARIQRIELSGGLTHQRLNNKTGGLSFGAPRFNESFLQSNTRFSSTNVALPVPTYRGSLVLAFGVNRLDSFDGTLHYVNPEMSNSFIRSESGGLYAWSLGGAVDLSPQVSVGVTANLWRGKYDYTLLADSTYSEIDGLWSYRWNDAITDRYSGWNAKLGTRIQPNKFLIFGATIETPVTYTIDEEWAQMSDTVFYSPERPSVSYQDDGVSKYKFTLPFQMGFGVAFNLNNAVLAADVNYADWTQMEYKRLADRPEANRVIKEIYKEVLRWHVGAEYTFPRLGASIRAGYYENPLPSKFPLIKSDRRYMTFGFGILIDQVTTVDLAFVRGTWQVDNPYEDLASKYTANQIFLSLAYRL